jgi:hypothetical protein
MKIERFAFSILALTLLASISLTTAPTLRAQETLTINDPAEYSAYSMAITQADAKAKAAGLESFLTTYPQSIVKKAVLDLLLDTYSQLGDADHGLSAASRLLQVDPGNMKAIFLSMGVKKSQCGKTSDTQVCDDAAALAQQGLTVPKPDSVSDDLWKRQTDVSYPVFHSAIALDDVLSRKDFKAAISEYRTELMILAPDQTKSGSGLSDTVQLAEIYVKPESLDLVKAVWFYSRAWNYAPPAFKPVIEQKIEYWYRKYHGGLDGMEDIKVQAAVMVFPPEVGSYAQSAPPATATQTTSASGFTQDNAGSGPTLSVTMQFIQTTLNELSTLI